MAEPEPVVPEVEVDDGLGLPDLPDLPDIDDPLDESEEQGKSPLLNSVVSKLNCCKCRNPIAGFFHIVFKVCGLLSYLFVGFFTSASFVIVFIICIIFMAIDFYATKNISGRFLVGLRWWNEVDDEGKSHWKFSSKDRSEIDTVDAMLFWTVLLVYPVCWIAFVVISIMKANFAWMLIPVFGIIFSIPNIWGYMLCQKDAKKKIRSFITKEVMKRVIGGGQ